MSTVKDTLYTEHEHQFDHYSYGDGSGTLDGATQAIIHLGKMVDGLVYHLQLAWAQIEKLEERIERLENPDGDEGSWGVYKHAISHSKE